MPIASLRVVGQVGTVGLLGAVLMLLLAVVLFDAVEVVDDGELVALYVLGEYKTVLAPGINFVPPFVSDLYPIDPRTETVELADRRVELPAEGRENLARHTDVEGLDGRAEDR